MRKLLWPLLALGLLTACSSEPSKPAATKPAPKEPEYLTGERAFYKLYLAAHRWAPNAQGFRLESVNTQDWKGKDGKAGVWRGSFASATMQKTKPYTWSGTDAADAPERGVNPGPEDTYVAGNASTHVFDIAFLKIDTDKALEVALKHGGDKLLEKDANQPLAYVLDWNAGENALVWHVAFGNSRNDAKLTVLVNASTGGFMRVEK